MFVKTTGGSWINTDHIISYSERNGAATLINGEREQTIDGNPGEWYDVSVVPAREGDVAVAFYLSEYGTFWERKFQVVAWDVYRGEVTPVLLDEYKGPGLVLFVLKNADDWCVPGDIVFKNLEDAREHAEILAQEKWEERKQVVGEGG